MSITMFISREDNFSGSDVFDLITYIIEDATVDDGTENAIFFSGTFNGQALTATLSGFNFEQTNINGEDWVTGGIADALGIQIGGEIVSFSNMNIDMSVFHPINFDDQNGTAPLGIENFFMSQTWDLNFSDEDDILRPIAVVGDGADFNLQGNDIVRTFGGNDLFFAGDGNDRIFGGAGDDTIYGGTGNDLIHGNSGSDNLRGGDGADRLFGGSSADTLMGGDGNDRLQSDVGFDRLFGNAGSDDFIFSDVNSTNVIMDFDALDAQEDIVLTDVTEITDYADLDANHMNQVGNHVLINDGAGTRILLRNTDINDLDASDFIF